ncbi:hypothetical protein V8J88_21325 [Massilia sp. W12]|uniref:hypothetical protein n=1 Tax=Massilia sp. W12 TaxID=3126507 RepID=UPI0030D42EAF
MDSLSILRDYVEGRMSHPEWLDWWALHSGDVEAQLGRFAFLKIKKRGFSGALSILEEAGVQLVPASGFCNSCGEPLFKAVPGVTTAEEIRAFASLSKIGEADEIVESGWIHPGEYCPNGCTIVLHSYRRA